MAQKYSIVKLFVVLVTVVALASCGDDPTDEVTPPVPDLQSKTTVTSKIEWTYTDDVITTEHIRLDTVEVDYNFGMTLKITSDLSFHNMRLAQRRRYYKKPQPSDLHPEYTWETNVAPDGLNSTEAAVMGFRTYTIHWDDPDRLLFFANDTESHGTGMHKSDTWFFTFEDSDLNQYTVKVNQDFIQKSVGYVTVKSCYTYITTNFRN